MYSRGILKTHLWVPKREVDGIKYIKDSLTVSSAFSEGAQNIKLFRETKKWFGFPLHHFLHPETHVSKIEDQRSDGKPIKFGIITKGFREGQEDLIRAFSDRVREGNTGFLLSAPTGGGKTFVATHCIRILKRTVLVVVNKSDLIDQWVDELLTHTNIKRSHIGIGAGGKIDWEGKKIVIALVHTLGKDREPDDFKNYFGTVIYDEADKSVPPETFAPVGCMFNARYRIGMSATLTRRDGLHIVYKKHIGECRLKTKKAKKMKSMVLAVFLSWDGPKIPSGLPIIFRKAKLLSIVAENFIRNRLIAKYVKGIVNSNRRALVVSERTKMLKNIHDILSKSSNVGYYTASVYTHTKRMKVRKKGKISYVDKDFTRKVDKSEQEYTKENCEIMLGTNKMIDTGTNIPDLSGLVIASPISTVTQLRGRIERFLEGKKDPVIVHFVDVNYLDALKWWKACEKEYKRAGMVIKEKYIEG